ncbi:MAG: hypothetical protein H7836_04805 [Magnetococcus sp. YQC-3]
MASDIMTLSLAEFKKNIGVDRPHAFNRYMGGNHRKNHPYVSGYWQFIINPPKEIFKEDSDVAVTQWLHSSAESFSPPSRVTNFADIPGMGGTASSFATGGETTREFTVAY